MDIIISTHFTGLLAFGAPSDRQGDLRLRVIGPTCTISPVPPDPLGPSQRKSDPGPSIFSIQGSKPVLTDTGLGHPARETRRRSDRPYGTGPGCRLDQCSLSPRPSIPGVVNLHVAYAGARSTSDRLFGRSNGDGRWIFRCRWVKVLFCGGRNLASTY